MASYFDHFVVIEIITMYFSDAFMVLCFVSVLCMVLSKFYYIIPNRFQSIIELIIEHWLIVVKENLGEQSRYYVLPLVGLFLFLLGLNGLGFFLYTFPCTTHLSLTFGLAISVWLGTIFLGFRNFKTSFLSMFMPTGAPLGFSPLLIIIEFASHLSRPIALGLRLAANLTAGHVLLAILSDFGNQLLIYSWGGIGLFPVYIIICMTILEMGVLVIQAYVFTLLSMIYLKDSIILH